ncbi:hypothetical protein D1867_03385 [Acidianus infernus]|uniref:Uncharacterized protein n=1 Tax=Acidianus infernus TaxID=12915 RepID=A0A6A9QGH1_ACIIN|nr:hypothetical protein [Acidianus infernus]MUM64310.1 hypothetical protein [Acidianus infernus]
MLFEISIDKLQQEEKGVNFISNSGHLVSFSSSLFNELNRLGIDKRTFAEIVIDFLNEGTKYYSTYIKPISNIEECKYYSRIFEFWITSSLTSKQMFAVITNYDEISEVLIIDPQVFNYAVEKLLNYASTKDCMKFSMPFIYKFVVFETFNIFKKKFNANSEKIIGKNNEKFLIAKNVEDNALIWKIEAPQFSYVSNYEENKANV